MCRDKSAFNELNCESQKGQKLISEIFKNQAIKAGNFFWFSKGEVL